MSTPRTIATSLFLCGAMALAAPRAEALPGPGATLPAFTAPDLAGQTHHSREIRQPTLVIVCTSAEARAGAEQWLRAAQQRVGNRVRIVTVVALSLPFFVPDGMVMDRARPETPRTRWRDTWLDSHGRVQQALGVSGGSTPWVLALDASGRVVASAHGAPRGEHVERVLASF